MTEPSGDDPAIPRGCVAVGGRSLARRQLDAVLALDCDRIVFAAPALSGELVALQHVAEAASASFHVVDGPRALAGLVAPADELVVLADGLLIAPADAAALLGGAPVVLTLPAERGMAEGFERIDLNRAAAGAMVLPGKLAASVAELPAGWSLPSALLRLAVQSGVPQRELPAELLEGGRWALVRGDTDAVGAETAWLERLAAGPARPTPGEWVVREAARRVGPSLLHAGTRPRSFTLGAIALAVIGLGAGWLGAPATGFVALALGWTVHRLGALLARIEPEGPRVPGTRLRLSEAFDWGLDAAFVALATWRSEVTEGVAEGVVAPAFAPLVLFGLLRLIAQLRYDRESARWLEDRLLAGLALAAASAFAPFDAVVMVAALALLAAGLATRRRAAAETRSDRAANADLTMGALGPPRP